MNKRSYILSTVLMAIAAITLLIAGFSEGSTIMMIAGGLFFLAILIMRARQIRELNKEIENMEKEIENEVSDLDNE